MQHAEEQEALEKAEKAHKMLKRMKADILYESNPTLFWPRDEVQSPWTEELGQLHIPELQSQNKGKRGAWIPNTPGVHSQMCPASRRPSSNKCGKWRAN